ncbi:hypothetical protein BR93DRAFT_956248 [Coniochaeta sp. PMI_546]|nr:hypothetical protein BR93DRAFT_956248 [Coniochaeta sp. PMI_546]
MPAAKKAVRGGTAVKTTKTAPAANKVTKPAQTKQTSGRRTSGRLATAIENSDEGRAVLAEKSANQQPASKATTGRKAAAAKDVAMIEESVVATPPPAKTKVGRGRPKKTVVEEDEIQETQQEPAPKPAPAKRGRKPAAAKQRAEMEIPETQQQDPEPCLEQEPSAMDLDLTMDTNLEDLPNSPAALIPPSVLRNSRAPVPQSATRRPLSATSFLTTLPASDDSVALRRRIGELTKQYTALETRYRDLRDIAARDAEINFDRLRKQTDERAAAATALIDSLKSELAVQRELAREGAKHKTQLDLSEARVDRLQQAVAELTTSLSESKAENKNLSVKLAAARGTEAAKAAAAVPASAVKNGLLGKANGEGIHAATVMQMKEDLYGDLTGLIVRGVKNVGGEDVFDCLQTGRNGTLHFKLAINNDTTSEVYDEAHYRYMPQLDEGRDAELIEILPDYLVEEITFPRPHAAKFYARVIKSLTERVVDEE